MPAAPEVITAVPTPFDAAGDLDVAGARRLFGFVAAHTDGLFVAGTTGEFPALDDAERLWLVKVALEAAGPDGVIAHVGAPDGRRAARLTASAVRLGVRRVAAVTPHYLPADPDDVTRYFERVAAAADGADVYAYLFPDRTGVTVTPEHLAAVAGRVGLAGVKLSGSVSTEVARYVAATPAGFRVYSGNDALLPEVAADGGAGVVSGVSAALPGPFMALARALGAAAADGAAQRVTAGEAERVAGAVALLGAGLGRLKHALAVRGLIGETSRMAAGPLDAETRSAIARLLGDVRTS